MEKSKKIISPIRKIRKDNDLTLQELALLAGISYGPIHAIEAGKVETINNDLLSTLEELGYDKEEIKSEYRKFKEEYEEKKKEDILQKFSN